MRQRADGEWSKGRICKRSYAARMQQHVLTLGTQQILPQAACRGIPFVALMGRGSANDGGNRRGDQ